MWILKYYLWLNCRIDNRWLNYCLNKRFSYLFLVNVNLKFNKIGVVNFISIKIILYLLDFVIDD